METNIESFKKFIDSSIEKSKFDIGKFIEFLIAFSKEEIVTLALLFNRYFDVFQESIFAWVFDDKKTRDWIYEYLELLQDEINNQSEKFKEFRQSLDLCISCELDKWADDFEKDFPN